MPLPTLEEVSKHIQQLTHDIPHVEYGNVVETFPGRKHHSVEVVIEVKIPGVAVCGTLEECNQWINENIDQKVIPF